MNFPNITFNTSSCVQTEYQILSQIHNLIPAMQNIMEVNELLHISSQEQIADQNVVFGTSIMNHTVVF